jgi:hypothetical protein
MVVVVMSDVDLVSVVVDQYLVPPGHRLDSAAAADLRKRMPHRVAHGGVVYGLYYYAPVPKLY